MSLSPTLLLPVLMCLCFVAAVAIFGGGIYFFVNRSVQGVNRTWGDLGTATGLTLKPAGIFSQPELNGTFRGRALRLYTYDAGSQGHRDTHTSVTLTVRNPTDSMLEITPSGTVGSLLGKMIKAQDVEIGNPEFDARFVIKSNPPDFAVKALGEARVLAGIMGIPGAFRVGLDGPSLHYSKGGLEDKAEFLTRVFSTLSDLADRLEALPA
jgi:hypothetical protein